MLISALMFWGIYIFINPAKITHLEGEMITAALYQSAIVMTILSAIILYVVVKIIRIFDQMKKEGLVKGLKYICAVALMAIVVFTCFIGVSELVSNMQIAVKNNQNIENTCAILVLRFIVEQLPNVCIFVIISSLLNMAGQIRKGLINQEVLDAINKISVMCKVSIIVILFSIMMTNIIQMVMVGIISIANYNVTIPVFEILFIIVLLLIVKMVAESYKIKEDNDLFI